MSKVVKQLWKPDTVVREAIRASAEEHGTDLTLKDDTYMKSLREKEQEDSNEFWSGIRHICKVRFRRLSPGSPIIFGDLSLNTRNSELLIFYGSFEVRSITEKECIWRFYEPVELELEDF